MGSVHNTIDKFGRRRVKNQTLVLRGQQCVGFKSTPNGNYDLQNKRLTNVGGYKDENDAATCEHLDNLFSGVIKHTNTELNRVVDNLNSRITELKRKISGSPTGE